MPNNPAVWIVGFIVLALVVLYMVRKGIGGTFKWGDKSATLNNAAQKPSDIKVGDHLNAQKAELGDVTGVKKEGSSDPIGNVDVLANADLRDAKVKNITGVEIKGGAGGKSGS
jgi:hypothetical protein